MTCLGYRFWEIWLSFVAVLHLDKTSYCKSSTFNKIWLISFWVNNWNKGKNALLLCMKTFQSNKNDYLLSLIWTSLAHQQYNDSSRCHLQDAIGWLLHCVTAKRSAEGSCDTQSSNCPLVVHAPHSAASLKRSACAVAHLVNSHLCRVTPVQSSASVSSASSHSAQPVYKVCALLCM